MHVHVRVRVRVSVHVHVHEHMHVHATYVPAYHMCAQAPPPELNFLTAGNAMATKVVAMGLLYSA